MQRELQRKAQRLQKTLNLLCVLAVLGIVVQCTLQILRRYSKTGLTPAAVTFVATEIVMFVLIMASLLAHSAECVMLLHVVDRIRALVLHSVDQVCLCSFIYLCSFLVFDSCLVCFVL